jgi:hypothetical protein
VASAEAYSLVSAEELASDPFKVYQAEYNFQRDLRLATDAMDVPLVSVIIRSTDRPTLSESLGSIALQTYPNIEVVVVNAKGGGHSKQGERCGHFPVRVVDTGEMLRRSRAGNVGLCNAKGDFMIFLDDDDWFMPDHISTLMEVLRSNPDKMVAYSCATCVNEKDEPTGGHFCQPFDRTLLLAGNYIPIHAALFSRTIVDGSCRMDESLDLYEDWDFWLQAATYGDFIFVDHVSAYVRMGGQFGQSCTADAMAAQRITTYLFEKWRKEWRREDLLNIMACVQGYRAKVNELTTERDAVAVDCGKQIAGLNQALLERESVIQQILLSTSWRLTQPLRALKTFFLTRVSQNK